MNLENFVVDQIGDIKVLTTAILDHKEIYGKSDPYSDEGSTVFRAWLAENNICFYCRPNEDFFKTEGYALAEKEGNTYLLMENLS